MIETAALPSSSASTCSNTSFNRVWTSMLAAKPEVRVPTPPCASVRELLLLLYLSCYAWLQSAPSQTGFVRSPPPWVAMATPDLMISLGSRAHLSPNDAAQPETSALMLLLEDLSSYPRFWP